MRHITILLASLISLVAAKPAFLSIPVSYATLMPGAHAEPALLDNPEITRAHVIARADERINLAGDDVRSNIPQVQPLLRQSPLLVNDGLSILTSPAPLGADGRVVDTAEVAAAKAAHAAAHANERLNLANEAARSAGTSDSSEIASDRHSDVQIIATEAVTDARILDAQEVPTARTVHAVARDNGKINSMNEAASVDGLTRVTDNPVVPLVFGNGIVAALLPVGLDGRPVHASEVHVVARPNQKDSVNDPVKSVDALAVAGPALAYGRLVY